MYKILLNNNLSKDATDYYLKIIEEALNDEVEYVHNMKSIESNDIIIVVDAKDFCKVLLRYRKQKIIIWFQGAVPEEAYLVFKSKIKKFYWEVFEKIALKYSYLNLFVSNAMYKHYNNKYKYEQDNYLIIPCFNKSINKSAFFYPKKYDTNSFVYAGSLAKWQKINDILKIYKEIENNNLNTSLTIITKDTKQAKLLCQNLKIQTYYIKYISYDMIDNELKKYKFGFIIRDNITVNNVATPTKFSTYMANGIIPIYTNCIGDFSDWFKNINNKIELDCNLSITQMANKINGFNLSSNSQNIYMEFEKIFKQYYDANKYKKIISESIFFQKKIRIAIIVPSLDNKGPVLVAKNISDYMIKNNIYCEIFYFDDVTKLSFNCNTTKISIFTSSVINSFDIIHSHGIRPDLYNFFYSSTKQIKLTTLHNYIRQDLEHGLGFSKFKSKLFEIIWNLLLLRMNKIIVLSKDAKKYYRNILYNKNIDAIYNGLSPSFSDSAIAEINLFKSLKNKSKDILGTCSYLTHRKGLHQILEALNDFHNLIFIVIGDGPERANLEKIVIKNNLQAQCYFLGYKSNAIDYLKYFDYFVLPSYSEGFPLSLIEAASCQKATLVSNISIHREVFSKKEVAFAELDNLPSMKKAIKFLIDNNEELSKNIYKKYTELYTLEVMGNNYLELYKKELL
jgi:glycosyltransferase involved in cell wall biosynthesis